MRFRHILYFLVGVQFMINGVFFSSSLMTAGGATLICLFILLAVKKSRQSNTNSHRDLGPTYHNFASMRGKETYFAPLALIALIGGSLAYLFLPIENVYEKTAITIAGTGLIYILLASFAHGFATTVRHVLGILFGGLLLLGAGASAAVWWSPLKDGASDLITKIKVMTGGLHQTGDNIAKNKTSLSGEQLSSSENTNSSDVINDSTGLVDTTSNVPLMGSGDIAITYGQLIPYIVNKYGLTAADKPDVTFTMFPNYDNRYQAFKIAYYNRFFARTVDPEKKVSCDNYIVFIGLAEKWPVSYTAGNVYSVFWSEAERRGILYGCKRGAYVKRANLF